MRGVSRIALAVAIAVATAATADAREVLDDSWFLLTLAGARVGHTHRTVEVDTDGGTVTRVTTAMDVRRLGQAVTLQSDEEWRETADGLPVAYFLTRDLGTEETRLIVGVDGKLLTIEKLVGSSSSSDTLGIPGRLLFPEGQRRLHVSRGFEPGDRYSYLVFDPDFEDVGRVDVTVTAPDGLAGSPGGARRPAGSNPAAADSAGSYRLRATYQLYEGVEFTTWLDDRGRVVREDVPALGISSRLSTRDEATRVGQVFDIVAGTMIRSNRVIADPRAVDEGLYEMWVEGGDVAAFLPVDARQTVESRTDRGVLLRVRRVVPVNGGAVDVSAESGEMGKYLEGNALLQVSHPRILAAAKEAVGDARGGWESALRIERYVFDTMEETGFGSAFASALEVLQDRTGDCSEYAVLAAAMCRAVGVPSRVVAGLVHVGGRFAYHMWIEVWADGGWYALDPTIGEGSVDATHIKLASSAVERGAVGDLSLPIMRAMNKLGVEVVEYSD